LLIDFNKKKNVLKQLQILIFKLIDLAKSKCLQRKIQVQYQILKKRLNIQNLT